MPAMTKLIPAADAAPARKHAHSASLAGYLLGSGVFIAGVLALFSVAGFAL